MIRTGARCVRADRRDIWRLVVIDRGHRRVVTARALVNATGAWTGLFAETVLRAAAAAAAHWSRSARSSSGVCSTRDNVYVFQNHDRRLIFASPYERDFTLIGTVDEPFKGDPAIVAMTAAEIALSLRCRQPLFPRAGRSLSDVVRTIAGANAVIEAADRRVAARTGAMTLDRGRGPGAVADGLRRRRHHVAPARRNRRRRS